jgi:hypothetical protein
MYAPGKLQSPLLPPSLLLPLLPLLLLPPPSPSWHTSMLWCSGVWEGDELHACSQRMTRASNDLSHRNSQRQSG